MEYLIIIVVLGLAAIYVINRFSRMIKGKDSACHGSDGKCCGCIGDSRRLR